MKSRGDGRRAARNRPWQISALLASVVRRSARSTPARREGCPDTTALTMPSAVPLPPDPALLARAAGEVLIAPGPEPVAHG